MQVQTGRARTSPAGCSLVRCAPHHGPALSQRHLEESSSSSSHSSSTSSSAITTRVCSATDHSQSGKCVSCESSYPQVNPCNATENRHFRIGPTKATRKRRRTQRTTSRPQNQHPTAPPWAWPFAPFTNGTGPTPSPEGLPRRSCASCDSGFCSSSTCAPQAPRARRGREGGLVAASFIRWGFEGEEQVKCGMGAKVGRAGTWTCFGGCEVAESSGQLERRGLVGGASAAAFGNGRCGCLSCGRRCLKVARTPPIALHLASRLGCIGKSTCSKTGGWTLHATVCLLTLQRSSHQICHLQSHPPLDGLSLGTPEPAAQRPWIGTKVR